MSGIILLILRVAMTLTLYILLGWVFWLMWQTLKRETLFLSTRKVSPLILSVTSPEINIQTLHFSHGDVVIGRDLDCECALTDETVSARHLRLTYHHNQWWAEDLGSRNGTLLNDAMLLTPTILIHGDTVKCGNTTLLILFQSQNSSTNDTLSDTENML